MTALVPTATILATILAIVTTGCAGIDGTERGAIRENVIEPGITAIDQSGRLACGGDAATLRTAMEAYELLVGSPAPDEAALVTEGFIREASDLWDVADGRLVPVDPGCAGVAVEAPPTVEIVTSTEPPLTADEVFAELTADDIAGLGGEGCAREFAAIFAAVDRFRLEQLRDPDTLDELVASGYVEQPITLWQVVDDTLVPAEQSPCSVVAAP